MKYIGTASLKLSSGYYLILNDIVYAPSIRRDLIFVSILDKCDFTFVFGNSKVEIFCDSHLVGSGILSNGL